MVDDELQAVVMDNGSAWCKAGLAGHDAPSAMFPSVIGKSKPDDVMKSSYIGKEAQAKRQMLSLSYPIVEGEIENWDDMEALWLHTFHNELHVAPEEHPVLLGEPPLNRKESRERIAQIMFETFNVPAMYLATHALLSLYASGRTTGTVLDIGFGATRTVPIYDSMVLPLAVRHMDIGGRHLTFHLRKMLTERRIVLTTAAETDIVTDIKEKLCHVALLYDEQKRMAAEGSFKDVGYELPDGNTVTIGDQLFRCPEALFRPDKMGQSKEGIHLQVHNAIMRCDVDMRQELFANIVLSGATSMFPGIAERMQKEIIANVPTDIKVKVTAPPDCKFSSWIGGSILASLSSFKNNWIYQEEYEEHGPAIVQRKC